MTRKPKRWRLIAHHGDVVLKTQVFVRTYITSYRHGYYAGPWVQVFHSALARKDARGRRVYVVSREFIPSVNALIEGRVLELMPSVANNEAIMKSLRAAGLKV